MARRQVTISRALLAATVERGESMAQLSRETGISRAVLSRFVRGERTLTLPTADKLARYLGLELVQRERRRK